MKKDIMIWNVRQLLQSEKYFHVYPDIDKALYFDVDDLYQPETFYETAFVIYIYENKYNDVEYFVVSSRGIYWKYKNNIFSRNYTDIKEKSWFDFERSLLRTGLNGDSINISGITRKNADNLCKLINIFTEEYRNKDINRKYLVSVKGKIYGPWDEKYIKNLIRNGKLQKDIIRLNREDEEQKWYDIKDIPEFAEDISVNNSNIKKIDIMKCDPDILLFTDGMNLEKVEKLMIARENGKIFESIEKVGEYVDLQPHDILRLSEKFFVTKNILHDVSQKRQKFNVSLDSRRIVDY